ncbi:hypothetical protein [Asticcacaulis machinosus]|uniref:Uncharacterized protein n=1 Tax=Asticcacaulis machinosus TaxID=2984211 RepID=A0ABT5HHN2_9CAUL|nr:hypothetical protein [Asticcacaulis machinosus]MDC7675702.1 hypothetical protein [Asticcacaulis machinosus]
MGRIKRHINSWVLGVVPVFIGFNALACQPCGEALSLPDTIHKAEVIVIGERRSGGNEAFAGGLDRKNDYITLTVSKVLKGQGVPEEISVRSWYGMCPYGIDIDKNQPAIVYLRKAGTYYVAVDDGCAEKFTPMQGDKVVVDKDSMALADFRKLYGL